jgi:hypothetical protein
MCHRLSVCFACFFFFLVLQNISGQEPETSEKFHPHHSMGIILAHAHIFQGKSDNGHNKALGLASWGIDYDFHFHPKWSAGLHTDIILEQFKVEKFGEEDEEVERSYPVAPAAVLSYHATHHWSLLLGAGVEFEKNENFFLNRLGIEYAAPISGGWEVSGNLSYDIKWKGYDTWMLGIGIIKELGSHHKK